MVALTAKFLSGIKPPASGRVEYTDDACKGLTLRVTSGGAMTWAVRYTVKRSGKSQQRSTLGPYPQMSLADARKRAIEIVDAAEQCIDLLAEKEEHKKAAEKAAEIKNAHTVDALLEKYLKAHKSFARPTSHRSCIYEVAHLRHHFGQKSVHDLKRSDVLKMVEEINAVTKVQGNRVWSRTKAFLAWCVMHEILEHNVCASVTQGHLKRSMVLREETPKDRVLTDEELKAVLLACDGLGYPVGWAVKMILYTACRRNEIFEAPWEWVDLQKGEWLIPAEHYKTKVDHLVPLCRQAKQLLTQVQQLNKTVQSPWVFHAIRYPKIPFKSFTMVTERISELTGVTGWTIHDLRRTVRTGMATIGVTEDIAERCLGHKGTKIVATYNVYKYRQEKLAAFQKWADHMDALRAS